MVTVPVGRAVGAVSDQVTVKVLAPGCRAEMVGTVTVGAPSFETAVMLRALAGILTEYGLVTVMVALPVAFRYAPVAASVSV